MTYLVAVTRGDLAAGRPGAALEGPLALAVRRAWGVAAEGGGLGGYGPGDGWLLAGGRRYRLSEELAAWALRFDALAGRESGQAARSAAAALPAPFLLALTQDGRALVSGLDVHPGCVCLGGMGRLLRREGGFRCGCPDEGITHWTCSVCDGALLLFEPG